MMPDHGAAPRASGVISSFGKVALGCLGSLGPLYNPVSQKTGRFGGQPSNRREGVRARGPALVTLDKDTSRPQVGASGDVTTRKDDGSPVGVGAVFKQPLETASLKVHPRVHSRYDRVPLGTFGAMSATVHRDNCTKSALKVQKG